MCKFKCILCLVIFIYCNIFNISAQAVLVEDHTNHIDNTTKPVIIDRIIWENKEERILIRLNPDPDLETQATFQLSFNNPHKFELKDKNKNKVFDSKTEYLYAKEFTNDLEISLVSHTDNFLDTLRVSEKNQKLRDVLIPIEIGKIISIEKIENERIKLEKEKIALSEEKIKLSEKTIELEKKKKDATKKGLLLGSLAGLLLGFIPFFFNKKRTRGSLEENLTDNYRNNIIDEFEKQIINNISKGDFGDKIIGFALGKYEEKIIDNISNGNYRDVISSAAQEELLLRIKKKNYNLKGYSDMVSPLILNTKNGYEELSTEIDKLIKNKENLEEDKEISKANRNNLENQIALLELELEDQKNKIAKSQIYPDYYSDFNEGLSEIYTSLSTLGDEIDHNSPFKEIVDTILTGSNGESQNPVFAYANRDKHILSALNLKQIKELANISPDKYFSKYVLWYCSDLINGLSRLNAYANSTDYAYNLSDKLEGEGIKINQVKQSYQQLEKLLSTLFKKKLISPKLGQPLSDITDYETVSYSFIRNNYYTEIQKLPSGQIYDFTKPQIVNIDNEMSIQKAQVNIKV